MRSTKTRVSTLLILGIAASPLLSSHADAAWPPSPSATPNDLADPSNWPNDPGYGYSAKGDGQWNFYSFMPQVAHPRPSETASGMSIDMAWRLSIGDPSVKIAITDSGIKWDEDDLIEKAWLNY